MQKMKNINTGKGKVFITADAIDMYLSNSRGSIENFLQKKNYMKIR